METTEHELDISTHDLTKRSTEDGLIEVCFVDVSTHDLTKRSTLQRFHRFFSGGCFNSRPHEEVDLWHRALGNQCNCFNSRPHEEVDNNDEDTHNHLDVSTHDLTKRSTLFFVRKMAICHCFNSRPHEEVDVLYVFQTQVVDVSTHDLTKRSTWQSRNVSMIFCRFNSRPHEEVDC